LFSTHGDLFYIGLNGIELYDQNGKALLHDRGGSTQFRVAASPSGVNSLPGMTNDIRTVDKLTNGKNLT